MANKEDMINHLTYLLKRGNEKKELVNNLIANDDYINWLDDFTKIHPEVISMEFPNLSYYYGADLDAFINLGFLKDFYQLIFNYARKNYIFPNAFEDYGNYYLIKIYDVFYEIGVIVDDERNVNFFCCRVNDAKNDRQFIDFLDIKENKIRHEVFYIEKKLEKLVTMIEQLVFNDNIPIEAISDTTDKVIRKILLRSKE